jgi:hypothetical protein
MPASIAKQPVTFVSLDDARAFCAHQGLRLPHAGGAAGDGRPYPWGTGSPNVSTCPPVSGGSGPNFTAAPPSNVDAHPGGCSPHTGVCDLIANTWEMTDEFTDQHNRAMLLKGGSNYYAKGSMWYFPNALPISSHQKAFRLSPGYERAATVGFRCVADSTVPPAPPPPDPCRINCSRCEQQAHTQPHTRNERSPCLCIKSGAGTCPPKWVGNGKASVASLDLGSAVASDWVAASTPGGVALSRMARPLDPTSTIEFGLVGANASALRSYCCSPLGISWSGGLPIQRKQSATGDGVDISKLGAGFSLRCAAASKPQTLTVLASCWSATCRLNASVTGAGGLGADTQSIDVSVGREVVTYQFEVVFSGGALSVTWELTKGAGNIPFQAALLSTLDNHTFRRSY